MKSNDRRRLTTSIDGQDNGSNGQPQCTTPLVTPAHLVRYADILRIYSLAVANGLARTAALAPTDSEAPAAFCAIEAWQLARDVAAVHAQVHALAEWLEGCQP